MLQVEHRKIWCDHCGGVRVEQLEFVDAYQRVTRRLGAYAVELCRWGLGRGRQTATLDEFFRKMPPTVRNCIQAVAIDMWEPYIHCVKRWCQNADIVFDLFHVVKAFNEVIDKIGNEEFRKADPAGQATPKGTKYLFLKLWGNLRRDERVLLRRILDMNERLNIVYWVKDFLAHIWEYHIPGWAEGAIAEWCTVDTRRWDDYHDFCSPRL